MPVPEPKPGIEDRVLAKATAARTTARGGLRAAVRQPATWWAAAAGALAATLACVAILWPQPQATPGAEVVLALNESRDVSLVIDSERALEGATIRLSVTGSVSLAGYEQQQEIEWTTSLTRRVRPWCSITATTRPSPGVRAMTGSDSRFAPSLSEVSHSISCSSS